MKGTRREVAEEDDAFTTETVNFGVAEAVAFATILCARIVGKTMLETLAFGASLGASVLSWLFVFCTRHQREVQVGWRSGEFWYLVSGILHRPNRLSDCQRV